MNKNNNKTHISIYTILIATALIPINIYWNVQMELVRYSGLPTTISLFFNVVFNLLVLSLLIFFIFMISTAYIRGKSIDCGCLLSDLSDSSAAEKRIYMLKRIVQDICFIVLSIIVKYGYRIKKNNDA